jgi:hypothetical protein
MSDFHPPRDRDAWSSIRGYIYQIDLSVERWLALDELHELELECGEDIDTVSRARQAPSEPEKARLLEQVKYLDRNLTLRSKQALEALANYAEHRNSNPAAVLRFRFLTNARPGRERPSPLPAHQKGIDAWESLRKGQVYDDAQKQHLLDNLRVLLQSSERPEGVPDQTWKHFEALLAAESKIFEEFIRGFEWSVGAIAFQDLRTEIQKELRQRNATIDARSAEYQHLRLFDYVARLLCQSGTKRLTATERDEILRQALPDPEEKKRLERLRAEIDELREQVSGHSVEIAQINARTSEFHDFVKEQLQSLWTVRHGALHGTIRPTLSLPVGDPHRAMRKATVDLLRSRVQGSVWTAIHGFPGTGKTQLVLLLASGEQETPPWLRLRGLDSQQALMRLHAAVEALVEDTAALSDPYARYTRLAERLGSARMLILDDLPRLYDGDACVPVKKNRQRSQQLMILWSAAQLCECISSEQLAV